jgi:proteasome lid subunit RPN8/RPN11
MATLHLCSRLRADIEAQARHGYPEETCGVLIGTCAAGAVAVLELVRASNLAGERQAAYALDGVVMLRAEQRAWALGVQVVGVWHTHPDAPAVPSEADSAAAWPGWSYLIVSVDRAGAAELRAWCFEAQQFSEEKVLSCPT